MPTLHQLIRNKRTVEIPTESDPLIITYHPAAITPRLEAISGQIRGRDDVTRKEQTDVMDEYLSHVIASWNFTEADGTPIPATPENIAALDYEAKLILFQGIGEDAYPGEANARPSSEPSESTSKPTARQATSRPRSRTGTR